MITNEKIESYLTKLSLSYESIDRNTWVINDEERGLKNVVIVSTEPVVFIRVKVMDIPLKKNCELFEKLLRLNASDIIHGAYALEDNSVILIDTLEGDTMDIEELQASLDAIGLALVQHYKILSGFRKEG